MPATLADSQIVVNTNDWSVQSGELVADCIGHFEGVTCVAFSPDNKLVASGSDDGTVRVWDADTGALIFNCEPPSEGRSVVADGEAGAVISMRFPPVRTVAFFGDSRCVASGGGDRVIRVWDAETGRLIATGAGHSGPVNSVAFFPDDQPANQRIVSGSDDGTVRLWNALNGSLIATSAAVSEPVADVAFSSGRRNIASRTRKGDISFWKRRNNTLVADVGGDPRQLDDLAFLTDAMRFIRETEHGTVEAKNVRIGVVDGATLEHSRNRRCAALSRDGKYIGKACGDGTVELLDSKTGAVLAKTGAHRERISSLAVSSGGKHIATSIRMENLRVWDASAGDLVAERPTLSEEPEFLAFSFDGTRIARGDKHGEVEIWNFRSDQHVRSNLLRAERSQICSVAFSPMGEFLATGHSDGRLTVWDTANAKVVCARSGDSLDPPTCVTGVAFSPAGQHIASVDRDGTVKVWKFGTFALRIRNEPAVPMGHGITKTAVLRPIARNTSSTDVFRIGNTVLAMWMNYDPNSVNSLAFSPDGARIVIGGYDKTVRLWDWRTHALTVLFFECPIAGVAFLEGESAEFVVAAENGETWAYRIAEPPS